MDVREFVNDIVWRSLDRSRSYETPNVFMALLPLYVYRYGKIDGEVSLGSVNELFSLVTSEDDLFISILSEISLVDWTLKNVSDTLNDLAAVEQSDYNDVYPQVVDDVITRFEHIGGKSMSVIGQPSELTNLISSIIVREGCKNIYNPFAGMASYATSLNGICEYHGQEVISSTCTLASIKLKAHGINFHCLTCEDSISCWKPDNSDCIVATPPFGLKMMKGQAEGHDNAESFCIDAALKSKADTAIFVVRSGFGISNGGSDLAVRKSLCEPNSRMKIEYVIDLPDNLFSSTGIAATVIVLKARRGECQPIFVDASGCCTKPKNKNILDVDKVLDLIDTRPVERVVSVDRSVLLDNNYSFSSRLYIGGDIALNQGEKVVKMSSIFEAVRTRIQQGVEGVLVERGLMSSDWYDCMIQKGQAKKVSGEKAIFGVAEPCIVLSYFGDALKAYVHDSNDLLILKLNQCALRVIDESISLDYAALLLLKDRSIQRYPFDIVGLDHTGAELLCRTQTITALENPTERAILMQKIKEETYSQRAKEEEARMRRLGISQLSSDISHMLGTTMSNSQVIIAGLQNMDVTNEAYPDKVQALIDCLNKTFRVIKYSGANLSDNEFSIEDLSMHDYLDEYVRAWKSYGSKCFALNVINEVSPEARIKADRTMLDIQLDTILDNAKKHGFGNKKKPENQVRIDVSAVSFKGRQFVQMRVSNNGKPMRSDMTMEDFISASRYRVDSGRLSQGGNHIYTIAKKNGGFFFLGNDDEGKMYIDILIPAVFSDKEVIYDYDRECI